MHRLELVGLWLNTLVIGLTLSEDLRPTLGVGNKTCADFPEIVSYHVHFMWDATNVTQSVHAHHANQEFAKAMNSPPGICPFSHANSQAGYTDICAFPFDWSVVLPFPTNETSGIFGGMNHAYFIPKIRAIEAINPPRASPEPTRT